MDNKDTPIVDMHKVKESVENTFQVDKRPPEIVDSKETSLVDPRKVKVNIEKTLQVDKRPQKRVDSKETPNVDMRKIEESIEKALQGDKRPQKRVDNKETLNVDMRKIKENIEKALQGDKRPPRVDNKETLNVDMRKIKENIEKTLQGDKRSPKDTSKKSQYKRPDRDYIKTGIAGFDDLLGFGIPKGSAILLSGGAGSGKTIFGLQLLNYHASQGKKCLYMSFEESAERLRQHMEDFGWDPYELEQKKCLVLERFSSFDVSRSVDALLMKTRGELLIDLKPVIFPKDFTPEFIVVDSLTALGSTFNRQDDSYRVYIEQLFRYFEELGTTSFFITETTQELYSEMGVEEFLADGVIVFHNIHKDNVREKAIEILKLRGSKHETRVVPFTIGFDGIQIYPDQEVFEEVK